MHKLIDIIASLGGYDSKVCLWDFAKLTEDISLLEETNLSHNPEVKSGAQHLLGVYPTKQTPILILMFTRRNLLLGAGNFNG